MPQKPTELTLDPSELTLDASQLRRTTAPSGGILSRAYQGAKENITDLVSGAKSIVAPTVRDISQGNVRNLPGDVFNAFADVGQMVAAPVTSTRDYIASKVNPLVTRAVFGSELEKKVDYPKVSALTIPESFGIPATKALEDYRSGNYAGLVGRLGMAAALLEGGRRIGVPKREAPVVTSAPIEAAKPLPVPYTVPEVTGNRILNPSRLLPSAGETATFTPLAPVERPQRIIVSPSGVAARETSPYLNPVNPPAPSVVRVPGANESSVGVTTTPWQKATLDLPSPELVTTDHSLMAGQSPFDTPQLRQDVRQVTIPGDKAAGLEPVTIELGKFGIQPRDIHVADPILQTVPTRLQPPGTNQTVFEALIPNDLTSRTRYRSPDAVGIRPGREPIPAPRIEPVQPVMENRGVRLSDEELQAAELARLNREAARRGQLPKRVVNGPEKPPIKEVAPVAEIAPPSRGEVESAVRRWINRRENTARAAAQLTARRFKDLTDPELIHQYQAGDRTGPLAEVEKYYNELFQKSKKAGILNDDAFKENYLRQAWNLPENEMESIIRRVKTDPNYAKQSVFQTYAQGLAAGFKPKFKTLPEILAFSEAETNRALANKEFIDFLESKGLKAKGGGLNTSTQFTPGPHQEFLQDALQNYIGRRGKGERFLHNLAQVAGFSKNLYLSGGLPGTPLNIHGYNIARSDFAARGAQKALGNFFKGVFRPDSERKYIASRADKILKWTDEGYAFHGETPHEPLPFQEWMSKYKPGRAVNWLFDKQRKLWEDPLFQVHLPYVKLRFTEERIAELTPKIGEKAAIKQAVNDANVFYGGLNNVLRDRNIKDAAKLGIISPDWLESRIRLAGRQYKAVGKTLRGKELGPEEGLYRKSFVRSLAPDLLDKGAKIGAGITLYDQFLRRKPGDVSDVDLGQTQDNKKERTLPIHGTAAEGIRVPMEVAAGLAQGDLGAGIKPLRSRLSAPTSSVGHLIFNTDAFGNPIYGKDRYGRPMSVPHQAIGIANELSAPIKPQTVNALVSYLNGQISWEEALAQGLELPFQYSFRSQPKTRSPFSTPR